MIRFAIGSAIFGAAALLAAQPASAAVLLCSAGGINLTVDQCIKGGNSDLANVSSGILAATGIAPINLTLIGKSDDNPSMFSFTPNSNPATGKTTNWTVLNGTLVNYVVVKAATQIKIYQLPGLGASTGINFDTLGMTNRGGKRPDISHLAFYRASFAAVPEPSTWALLIAGFGAVGAAMRRRRARTAFA